MCGITDASFLLMTLCGLYGVPASISEDEMVLNPVNQNGLPDPQQVTEIYFSHFFSEGLSWSRIYLASVLRPGNSTKQSYGLFEVNCDIKDYTASVKAIFSNLKYILKPYTLRINNGTGALKCEKSKTD